MPLSADGFPRHQEREKVSVFEFVSNRRNLIDIKHREMEITLSDS